ncbi:hypothetical protein [Zoogloea sp.]
MRIEELSGQLCSTLSCGEIVAEGPPESVVQVARSHTGRILGEFMAARRA